MACKPVCKLCDRLVISQSVTFTAGTGLIINVPANTFRDFQKICLVIAQAIPPETTISSPVFITIGDGTVQYPVVKCDCSQVLACGLRTRTRYSMVISTNATSGVFKLLGRTCCTPDNSLQSIDGTAPAAPATPAVASDVAVASVETTGGKKS